MYLYMHISALCIALYIIHILHIRFVNNSTINAVKYDNNSYSCFSSDNNKQVDCNWNIRAHINLPIIDRYVRHSKNLS